MTIVTRILLFCSSYAPLMLAIAILQTKDQNYHMSIAFVIAAVLSTLFLYGILHSAAKFQSLPVRIAKVKDRSGDWMAYFVTYLVAFMSFDLGVWQDIAVIGLLLVMLCAIYVRSELIFLNPTLAFFKYRVLNCEDSEGKPVQVITRSRTIGEMKDVHLRFMSTGGDLAIETGG